MPAPTVLLAGASGALLALSLPGQVVGPTSNAPAAASRQMPLSTSGNGRAHLIAAPDNDLDLTVRTAGHLPRGAVHAIFAPFPWSLTRNVDLPAIPDVLLWYVTLLAAVGTVRSARSDWRLIAPGITFLVAVLALLVLAEGNVGTLYRHRAMATPFALVLAAPTLVAWFSAIRNSFASSVRRS